MELADRQCIPCRGGVPPLPRARAEEQGHHPDLHVGWGRCAVEIWTHKIDGLTESDFFLAAKTDREFRTGDR